MTISKNLGLLAPQVSSSGNISYADLTNKPSLSTVATSGSYADLTNKPVVISLKGSTVTYPGDDLAADPAGAQTILITGTGFESTPTVYVGGTIAPAVTFVSSTQLTFTTPAKAAGTYDIYIVNPGGATAIMVMGISYSGVPTWTTAAGNLGSLESNWTIQLQATSNSAVTYALTSGSVLPTGVTLSSSGLITGVNVTVEQTFNFSVTVIDAELQDTPRSFSVTITLGEPYFKFVTVLLSGNPVVTLFNADASANSLNLSINGDVKASNLTPFTPPSGTTTYGSGYFDGSGDYLSTPSTANLSFGSGNFTIEAWVYANSLGSYNAVFSQWPDGGGTANNSYVLEAVGSNMLFYWVSGTTLYGPATLGTITTGAWIHYTICRSGNTLYPFKNGVLGTTVSITETLNSPTSDVTIGGQVAGAGYWDGYISNVRVVKGTALYTSTFTPSTTPLTAITNTSLLTLQNNGAVNNNSFKDNSANNFAITRVGNTTQGTFSPYGTSWSNYFNGVSTYLEAATNAEFALPADFTLEMWMYPLNWNGGNMLPFAVYPGQPGGLMLGKIGSDFVVRASDTANQLTFPTFPATNTWTHVAVVRSGNTLSGYFNGTRVATTTNTFSFTQSMLRIGSEGQGSDFVGYLSNLRLVKGTAVYNPTLASLTVPTAPLTAISGTSVLACQSNRFKDSSTNNFAITTSNSPSVQRFNPFGANQTDYSVATIGGSGYFDGTGDYITIPTNTAFSFGTGDFTISTWIYTGVDSLSPGGYSRSPFTLGNVMGYLRINAYHGGTTGAFRALVDNNTICDGSTVKLSDNAWHNITIVRESGNIRHWIDGVYVGTIAYSANITNNVTNGIGGDMRGPDGNWNGYIAGTYVNKGTALFTGTSNITVPTTPPTSSSGNSLLVNFTNANIIDNAMMNNFETVGNVQISTSVKKYGTGSLAFFNNSGYLKTPDSVNFELGNGNWTIEAWIYPTSTGVYPVIAAQYGPGSGNNSFFFSLGGNTRNLDLYLYTSSGNPSISATDAITLNTWQHVAAVRSSDTVTLYVNGIAVGSPLAFSNPSTNSTYPLTVGWASSGTDYPFFGYIDDFRFTKGYARYTANFTPPTSAHRTK